MEKFPTIHNLLHDPTLSFSDFCIISNAMKEGFSEEEILSMPELLHLRVSVSSNPRQEL
jgi:hypothetical protein